MSEILTLRGRLAVNEKLINTLTIGIDTDISELRTLADKFEPKTDLQTDRIKLIAARIDDQVRQLREITAIVKTIKKDLGE
jgi:hypothetical protein